MMRSTRDLVSITSRCLGPVWSAVMYGMFTWDCCARVSSTRAAVAASNSLRRSHQIFEQHFKKKDRHERGRREDGNIGEEELS